MPFLGQNKTNALVIRISLLDEPSGMAGIFKFIWNPSYSPLINAFQDFDVELVKIFHFKTP